MTKYSYYQGKIDAFHELGRKTKDWDQLQLILECICDCKLEMEKMTVEEAEEEA